VIRPRRFREAFVGYHWLLAALVLAAYALVTTLSRNDLLGELDEGTRENVYLSLAGTAGVLLGFAITGVTIFLSLGSGRGLDLLRGQTDDFPYIRKVLMGSIYAFALAAVWMTAMLVLDTASEPEMSLEIVASGVLALTFFRTWALLWLLNSLLRLAVKDAGPGAAS